MLSFSPTLRTTAALLVQSLNTPQIAARSRPSGPEASVEVVNGAGNTELQDTGPYLAVVAESTSPSMSQAPRFCDRGASATISPTCSSRSDTEEHVHQLADVVAPTMPQRPATVGHAPHLRLSPWA